MATQFVQHPYVPLAAHGQPRTPKREKRTLLYVLDLVFLGIVIGPLAALPLGGRLPTINTADIPALFGALLAILAAFRAASRRNEAMPGQFKWCVAFLVIATVSLVQSADILTSIGFLKATIAPSLVFLMVWHGVRSERSARHLIAAIVICAGLIALLTLYNFNALRHGSTGLVGSQVTIQSSKDYAQTSFGKSNYLASIFVLVMPYAAFLCVKSDLRRKLLGGTCFLVMAAALTLTQARGAFGSIILGLLTLGILNIRRLRLSFGMIAWGIVMLAGFCFVVYRVLDALPKVAHDFGSQVSVLQGDELTGNYAGNRADIWRAAIKDIANRPLVGVGIGNEQIMHGELGMRTTTTHNLALEVLLLFGIVGFIPFTVFMIAAGAAWWKTMRRGRSPFARQLAAFGFLSFLIMQWNCSVEPSFWALEYAYLAWALMALGFVLRYRGSEWGAAPVNATQGLRLRTATYPVVRANGGVRP